MTRTLADFVSKRREELGIRTQTELGQRTGLPRTTINRIETGVTQLPEADIRRRLAKALEVSHLDMLVAAGEILPEEIRAAGVEGVIERDPNDLRAQLHRAVDAVPNWSDAPGIARSLLWTMQGVRYDQTPHTASEPSPSPVAGSESGR